ncbi:hypothetical protein T439DRAFT_325095 [Meredithblackwellia eburnea MCA 4105]
MNMNHISSSDKILVTSTSHHSGGWDEPDAPTFAQNCIETSHPFHDPYGKKLNQAQARMVAEEELSIGKIVLQIYPSFVKWLGRKERCFFGKQALPTTPYFWIQVYKATHKKYCEVTVFDPRNLVDKDKLSPHDPLNPIIWTETDFNGIDRVEVRTTREGLLFWDVHVIFRTREPQELNFKLALEVAALKYKKLSESWIRFGMTVGQSDDNDAGSETARRAVQLYHSLGFELAQKGSPLVVNKLSPLNHLPEISIKAPAIGDPEGLFGINFLILPQLFCGQKSKKFKRFERIIRFQKGAEKNVITLIKEIFDVEDVAKTTPPREAYNYNRVYSSYLLERRTGSQRTWDKEIMGSSVKVFRDPRTRAKFQVSKTIRITFICDPTWVVFHSNAFNEACHRLIQFARFGKPGMFSNVGEWKGRYFEPCSPPVFRSFEKNPGGFTLKLTIWCEPLPKTYVPKSAYEEPQSAEEKPLHYSADEEKGLVLITDAFHGLVWSWYMDHQRSDRRQSYWELHFFREAPSTQELSGTKARTSYVEEIPCYIQLWRMYQEINTVWNRDHGLPRFDNMRFKITFEPPSHLEGYE